MQFLKYALVAAAAAAALNTHAATLALGTDGSWSEFDVAADIALAGDGLQWIDNTTGEDLGFSFTIAPGSFGTLTVVDAGVMGDVFEVIANGNVLGQTSAVPLHELLETDFPAPVDFSQTLADSNYSRGVFTLGAGSYTVTGRLTQSWTIDGFAQNATLGGVKLEVSAVPEPASLAAMLAGLAVVAVVSRRRA